MLPLAALMLATAAPTPAIFWHSESHRGGSTVLALGGALENAAVELCTVDAASGASGGCSNATRVVDSHAASVKFAVGGERPPSHAYAFRACELGNSKEQLFANSRELAKHNLDRYNNLSPIGKLYENITNITWSNSGVNVGSRPPGMSRVEENKLRLKHLNASKPKQEF